MNKKMSKAEFLKLQKEWEGCQFYISQGDDPEQLKKAEEKMLEIERIMSEHELEGTEDEDEQDED